MDEYFIHKFPDFVSDIGGNLGLFLGWSILSIIQWITFKINEFFNKNSINA